MRIAVLAILIPAALAAAQPEVQSGNLFQGWLKMYDLKFDEAHQVFGEWKQSHPADALGPASDAAAFLFPNWHDWACLRLNYSRTTRDSKSVPAFGRTQG